MSKILIIGGSALGPKAAARARRRDPKAEITIIDRGDIFSYAGCGMPFYIGGEIRDIKNLFSTSYGVPRDENYFKKFKNINLIGRTEAVKINRHEKTVTVKNLSTGEYRDLPYDKLVLGVGAFPAIPPIEGINLQGVFRLYNLKDAEAIKKKIDEGANRVVIVGGGLIGLEVCGALLHRKCRVTILEMMERLAPSILDTDMALILEKYLKDKGVIFRLGSRVMKILDDGSGNVSAVQTFTGDSYPADLVLLAVGVKPNINLAKNAGLEIGSTGAIAVDEFLRTNDPDIYAGGDCVENYDIVSSRKVYLPLGSTANKHGRIIGDNITGGESRFQGIVGTVAFKVLELNIGKTGLTENEAKKIGFDTVTAVTPRTDCSDYYPNSQLIVIKLIADRLTSRLLGCQIIGMGEAIKRIDIVATCLKFKGTVKDLVDIDLGYAPPYSTAIDAIAHSANVIQNKIEGLAHGIPVEELKRKMKNNEDFVILDVRSRKEVEAIRFEDLRAINIPLDELRERLHELDKTKEIIIICETSVRAYEAERILRGSGFRDIRFLDGSLTTWFSKYQ